MVWLAYAAVVLLTLLTWFRGPKEAPGMLATGVFVGGMILIGLLGW